MMTYREVAIISVMAVAFAAGMSPGVATADEFEHPCAWTAFDPGDYGVGLDPDGYYGAVFDGRYVYFIPHQNNEALQAHGEVLRLDTLGIFNDPASWETYDPGAHGVGSHPRGYASGVFDGRYVYFIPWADASGYHGEVLRYDTTAPFADASAWAAYDAGAHGLGTDPDGYRGGVFDGRFVYFAPTFNGTEFHGEVLRLDTAEDFGDVSSWTVFDPGSHGVGNDADGYSYASFDGRYVYFSPYLNGTEYHGEVLRYDTTGDFSQAASWTTYDPGANGVGTDPDGYPGTAFDGRYVYFAPFNNNSDFHGEVLRYDTTGDFSATGSWTTFDAKANGIGDDPTGYLGAVFDGRYVYLVPSYNNSGDHDEFLRYDTFGEFSDPSSWTAFEPDAQCVGVDEQGYREGAFDGRFVYFAPAGVFSPHGQVLRFSTLGCLGDFDLDLDIDPDDAAAFMLCWDPGKPVAGECDIGDFDGDEDVDCNDWNHFKYAWTGPPTCPPAFPDCEIDCNANNVVDECEIATGTGQDCQPNGTPDDCDVNPTDPDGNGEVSGDDNTDGIPDECQCTLPAAPLPESTVPDSGFGRRVRYLSFRAGTSGNQEALRVTFADMPANPPAYDFRYAIGWTMWVGQPRPVSEVPGKTDDTPPTFWAATLQCDPYFTDWTTYDSVHVYGMEIVPRATYKLQAVGQGCETAEGMFSTALTVDMSAWGNVVGGSNQQPPNSSVDFNDISSVVDKFKNLPAAPSKSRADVAPGVPDRIVDFTDIPSVVDAFRGRPYPYAGPQSCP